MITLASYNKFSNNILRDTFIISIGNCLTSIFAGFAIFSGIGFIAKQLGKSIDDVIEGGPGLAFVVYPEAISRMSISPLWAVLFFLMLITLGLDSMFAGIENIVSSIVDDIPRFRSKKILVLLTVCVIGCVFGLPLALGSGIYFLDLAFAVLGWKTLLNGILEFVIIGYLYGLPKFFRDIRDMAGWDPSWCMKSHLSVVFLTISPAILIIILLATFIKYEPFKSGSYEYPLWANIFGWIISFAPMLIIVFFIIKRLYDYRHLSLRERLRVLTTPTEEWYKNSKAFEYDNMQKNLHLTGHVNPYGHAQ
ncbi:Sodium- and chloride-dependent glycine transporter 2 [Nymphon striatum]|nr:Sodium- and chloride-dependent glycine transporter 2 [Nymphon striatum]